MALLVQIQGAKEIKMCDPLFIQMVKGKRVWIEAEEVHGTGKNLLYINGVEARMYKDHAKARKKTKTTLNQIVDNMVVDKTLTGSTLFYENLQYASAEDELIFADSIGGKEAREYYLPSKMVWMTPLIKRLSINIIIRKWL
ncbi:hypothetical protein HAX54_042434 [Datura stramonium]|uniref:Uncharacterized protein n=1 Tax=Datura stramonium TaxID=4076 RepID=A0ABS8VZ95_DATST|nr:hypothetical protein [Datura stramonium]